jgi:hypothetical protein
MSQGNPSNEGKIKAHYTAVWRFFQVPNLALGMLFAYAVLARRINWIHGVWSAPDFLFS